MGRKNAAGGKRKLIGVLLASTFLAALGQLMFKYSLAGARLDPAYLLLGVAAYGASTIVYLYVLGRAHLSWAYGIGGLSYIFAVLLAALFLHESVTLVRWLGVAAIAIGAALVGSS